MSDPMTPEVRDWMKRTDVEPPEAQRSARQVMARLPEVRQRRRWWPFPVFYREPETPTTEDPSTIPATNGHTPTVTGRTTSMLSPVKAITAGALVFAIGGALFIAQPFDQRSGGVPGAETDAEPAPPVEVSGQHLAFDPNLDQDYMIQTWSMSDPRLDGTFKWFAHGGMDSDFGPIGFEVWAYVIENDEGTWRGIPDAWATLPGEDGPPPADMVFEGEGGYEGLTLLARFFDDGDNGYAMRGYIIDGDFALPPDFGSTE